MDLEAAEVRRAWGRVTGWLEQHAPDVFAALGGPVDPAAVRAAETRMGLELPPGIRQWLAMNDVDAGRRPEGHTALVALGCPDVVPGGGLLLGLTDIERVHLHQTEVASSDDPDCPHWRREWVPIHAETDGFHGTFVDARTGRVGSWSEGNLPKEGRFPSLAAYFEDVADRLAGAASGEDAPRRAHGRGPGREATERWARAHGYVVHDRGRIPADIRQPYEG
ncbi:hypothetical protein [Streptomyces sp. NPDC048202]|uniref:Lsr2 family DNA-binding protein n=1 Tax=Streptomyces sp. NPDC048202 TaxID=3365514 RepID=UPI0037225F63